MLKVLMAQHGVVAKRSALVLPTPGAAMQILPLAVDPVPPAEGACDVRKLISRINN